MVSSKKKKIIGFIAVFLVVIAGGLSFGYYHFCKKSNFAPQKTAYLYIYPNTAFNELVVQLKEKGGMIHEGTFTQLAQLKGADKEIKAGCYAITDGMNNADLLQMLTSGKQTPIQLKYNNIRTMPQFAGRISSQLMTDSVSLMKIFENEQFISKLGFSHESLPAMFIPNTYQLYWTTSPEAFCERMKKEFDRFWNEKRSEKAKKIGLTPVEISILASIVEEETNKPDEFPIVAGLYINRLKTGMKLQADPTVKYAIGDFALRRILYKHLEIDSPYNTYQNYGLPPGPIRFSSIQVIDAVLDYAHHDYIYMCAKEDLSGRHNFARTGAEHARNREKYTSALNQRGIYR